VQKKRIQINAPVQSTAYAPRERRGDGLLLLFGFRPQSIVITSAESALLYRCGEKICGTERNSLCRIACSAVENGVLKNYILRPTDLKGMREGGGRESRCLLFENTIRKINMMDDGSRASNHGRHPVPAIADSTEIDITDGLCVNIFTWGYVN
jgi:hypothetical protein